MLKVKKDPLVITYYDYGSNLRRFQENNQKLEEVTKGLQDYLETKRAAFPRFYFLTNDEMLEILSQTRNPQAVQSHLSKCFDAIKRIEFTDVKNSTEITAMVSPEGEKVEFS
jgi:dynein heavy chain, axonemal